MNKINSTEKPILELKGISKEFPGVKALDNAELKLYPGKCTTLMGENGAGKSTIMKVIFGIYKPNAGSIFFKGEKISFSNSKEALENGIAMVHQELNQVLTTNVMENMFIGRYPKSGPFFVDKVAMYEQTKEIFKMFDINIDPKININKLTVSERQMIEIARAVSYDSKVLILDEPTSSLTNNEVQKLFQIIGKLKKRGVAILFVSHKMEEIRKISDYITIFRDGKHISTNKIDAITDQMIIKDMVGRDMKNVFPKKAPKPKDSESLLEVKNLKGAYLPKMGEINFDLKKGEILGIAGLVGSKRTEILELIFGLRKKTHNSQILHYSKELKIKNPKNAIDNEIVMMTEERKRDGIFPIMDITFNTTIVQLKQYANPFALLNKQKMIADTKQMINALSIKTPSIKQKIDNLSGGNQQKVVISKWLTTQPDVLLMDEPTRGIDVGAKYQIYELLANLASSKKGVIVVSSELPELLGTCHRILVMSNGKQAGIVDANTTSQEAIMKLATKYY